MSFHIQRPGDRIITIGDMGAVRVFQPRGGAAASNWWEAGGATGCVAAYQPVGAASLAASYTDLSGNGNDCGPGTAPTWDAVNGWTFNGTTQYLTTGVSNALNQTWTMVIQFSGATAGTKTLAGNQYTAGANDNSFVIYPWRTTNNVIYRSGLSATQIQQAPQLATGNLAIAGRQGYRNGSADGGLIAVNVGGGSNGAVFIAAMNYNGSAIQFCNCAISAFALYDNDIGATSMAAVAAAMAAL